jgi:hypothetical protein
MSGREPLEQNLFQDPLTVCYAACRQSDRTMMRNVPDVVADAEMGPLRRRGLRASIDRQA